MRPILSLRDLAARLGIPIQRLRAIADEVSIHYKHLSLEQSPTKTRHLRVPDSELRDIQRRINTAVLVPIALGEGVHGGVRGKSPRTNAASHLAKKCVVNLDVRDFYPSVRHYVVYRMFLRDLGFGRDVARLLTRLTTLDAQLPQGSPTSTTVANLVLSRAVDEPLDSKTFATDNTSTRFVDDITLSGENPRQFINGVARLLSTRRLRMYRKRSKNHPKQKLKITPRSRPQVVTGLNVNSRTGPSIPRTYRDGIKSAIYHLKDCDDDATRKSVIRSILGKIAYVRQFNPGSAARLNRILEKSLA